MDTRNIKVAKIQSSEIEHTHWGNREELHESNDI